MTATLRFGKDEHLRKKAEFDRVFARRCSVSDGWLVVYGCPNELGRCRVGLLVSRKVGGAVQRNRMRRLYRGRRVALLEALARELPGLAGLEQVVVVGVAGVEAAREDGLRADPRDAVGHRDARQRRVAGVAVGCISQVTKSIGRRVEV